MGRYWYLRTSNDDYIITCEGKFWFGIQNSNDFENVGFKESEDKEMTWKSCGCIFQTEDMTAQFCTCCFDSYEEHKQSIEIELGEKVSFDNDKLYEESDFVTYEAKTEDIYDKICEIIKPIENDTILSEFFDKYVITYEKKENEIIINHKSNWDKPLLQKIETYNAEILARIILCKMIKFMIDLGGTEFYVDCEF